MFFKSAPILAAVPLAVFAATSSAQWKDWDYNLDQERKTWQELQVNLPPYPKPENLITLDIGTNATNQYFVDGASISVGEDGVVRYTLVIKAGGGATNVSFEGIRCDGRQVRVYAFGHPNSDWSRARNAGWRDIQPREINGYHYALHRDYFCWTSNRRATFTPKEILVNLRRGRPYHPSADDVR